MRMPVKCNSSALAKIKEQLAEQLWQKFLGRQSDKTSFKEIFFAGFDAAIDIMIQNEIIDD